MSYSNNDRLPVTTSDQGHHHRGHDVPVIKENGGGDVTGLTPNRSPIANPAPLGLAAFGMTTMLLGFVVSGWAGKGSLTSVITYAFFYGGAAQFVAGVFEMIKGNTFAATAFCSYGAFWLGTGLRDWIGNSGVWGESYVPGDQTGAALYNALWGLFTLCMFVATLRKNGCLMTVFGTLTITFFLLCGGVYSKGVDKAAGYMLLICGFSAFYTAMGEVWYENIGIQVPGLKPVRFI